MIPDCLKAGAGGFFGATMQVGAFNLMSHLNSLQPRIVGVSEFQKTDFSSAKEVSFKATRRLNHAPLARFGDMTINHASLTMFRERKL